MPRVSRLFSKPLFPALLLLCSVLLTLVAWYVSRNHLREKTRDRFDYQVHEIYSAIQMRMSAYEQVLRSAVGLFYAGDTVTRQEWRSYVETLRVQEAYPGILGLGYTVRLRPAQVAPLEQRVRAEGFPDFHVWPEGPRADYTSVVYLEPFSGRNRRAFGFDMFTEEKRHAAMLRAWQTGRPALSAMVTLVQETKQDVQKGCLLYLPVYARNAPTGTVEERMSALRGFVYSPFRINDLMKGILGPGAEEMEFEVYDGDNTDTARLFYVSHAYNPDKKKARYTTTRRMEVAGHNWTLAFTSRASIISPYEAGQPNVIALAGLLVNVLLAYVLFRLYSLTRRNRELAEAQRRFNEELERTVRLRTSELQRSNEDLERFAHVASHDLKEPVRKMRLFIDQLRNRRSDRPAEEQALLDKLARSAIRLNQMIESILQFSTVHYEAQQPAAVDLNATVQDVIDDLELLIRDTGAQFQVERLPVIQGSPALLHQLFYNLFSNSLKFIRAGVPPLIRLQCRQVEDGGRLFVELVMTDNGIGFQQSAAASIFQSFVRLHPKDRYEGTGLGLALCKRIVERHGGTIEAQGTPGEGAVFTVRLPLG